MEPPTFAVHGAAAVESIARDHERLHIGLEGPTEAVRERDHAPGAAGIVPSDPARERCTPDRKGLDAVHARLRLLGHETVRGEADRDLLPDPERGRQKRVVPDVEMVEGTAEDRQANATHGAGPLSEPC